MSGGHLLCADRSGAETDSPWSPHGWVCLVARAADCKSVTQKHRRFESCPIHFRLRVRVVYGAILLRWCAATHRRFKSFRKRFRAGMKCPALSVYILRHHVCAESFEDSLAQGVLCVWHIFHGTYLIRIYPDGIFIACTCRDCYERHCTAYRDILIITTRRNGQTIVAELFSTTAAQKHSATGC